MKIDETHFRSLLSELIDENPLCCRAVLSICRVEFTTSVETLCVSLGKRSILRVNLDFVSAHCGTEAHVKALITHEFLHVLLGHTTRFKSMSPALNIALDAVINSIIHRTLGEPYSSMMGGYYANAKGLLRLLRPATQEESSALRELLKRKASLGGPEREELQLLTLHQSVYSGQLVSDDLIDVARQMRSAEIDELLKAGKLLLGGHGEGQGCLDDLEPDVAGRVRQALGSIPGKGIWRDTRKLKPQVLKTIPKQRRVPPAWRAATQPLLRRLILPDPKARRHLESPASFMLPVLHPADRRGCLRTIWNPILPEISWEGSRPAASGTVQIYLDVSGSMNAELQLLVLLLAEFGAWIRKPLWAFSTIVVPATIIRGELQTNSTGGTALSVVLDHIRQTRPKKALVITDGFVESPDGPTIKSCSIEALIPASGTPDVLKEYGIPVSALAAIH
jgi:hypothetical protein